MWVLCAFSVKKKCIEHNYLTKTLKKKATWVDLKYYTTALQAFEMTFREWLYSQRAVLMLQVSTPPSILP